MNPFKWSILALSVAGLSTLVVACGGLSPSEQREISDTATIIANCQKVGRDCAADGGTGCFDKYDACMKDGGL